MSTELNLITTESSAGPMGPQAARKHPQSVGKDPPETLCVTMNTTQPVSHALITLMIRDYLENNLDSDGVSEEVRLRDVSEVELGLKVEVQTRSSDQNSEFRPGIRVQIRSRSSDQD